MRALIAPDGPEAPRTTAPPAAPLAAVDTGVDDAAPLRPDDELPPTVVSESPLPASAEEMPVEPVHPEAPPLPVPPEIADAVAVRVLAIDVLVSEFFDLGG